MKKYRLQLEQLEYRDVPSASAGVMAVEPTDRPVPTAALAQVANPQGDKALAARGIIILGGIGDPNARGIVIVGGIGNPNLSPAATHGFNPQPEPPGNVLFSGPTL